MSADHTKQSIGLERIVFFSDAVFAIAITILVLELKVPILEEHAVDSEILIALAGLIPKYVGFAASFMLIGTMWIEHHRIFGYITQSSYGLAWRNIALLFGVALVPFPTALFTEYYRLDVPLAIYAFNIAFVGLAKIWTWRFAIAQKLVNPSVPDAVLAEISWRSWAWPTTSLVVAVGALSGVPFAYGAFLATPLIAQGFAAIAKHSSR